MHARWGLTLALAVSAAAGFATSADAQRAKAAKGVTLAGCPQYGIPPLCVLMRGRGGESYMVNSASPPVPVGTIVIRLTGTPTTDPNLCFATVLTNIKWRATRQACPK
jgi:hypothetical protein